MADTADTENTAATENTALTDTARTGAVRAKIKQRSHQISNDEIDLRDLFLYFLQKWYLILIVCIAGAAALGAYTMYRPYTYTSTASLFIQTETTSITSLADVQLGRQLSADFIELAGSKAVLDTAIEEVRTKSGAEITRDYLRKYVDVTNTDDTRLLVFTVTTTDANLSCVIAEAMADATARQVSMIMNTDEPKIVDHAEVEKPNSKHLVRQIVFGGFGGAVIVCAILTVLYLLNDMVVTEDDLRKYLGVNVLGTVSLDRGRTFKKGKNRE